MRCWHDFHITSYAVDGAGREIGFELEWPYESSTYAKRASVVFGGVEGYFLEHDLGANIVYDFAERPLLGFLAEWAERFELTCKFGWPRFWRPKPYPERAVAIELEDSFQWLSDRGAKCIELSSSYGLSGWVLAATVHEQIVEV